MSIENEGRIDTERTKATNAMTEEGRSPVEETKEPPAQDKPLQPSESTQALLEKVQNMSEEELAEFFNEISEEEKARLVEALNMEVDSEKKAGAMAESVQSHTGENAPNIKQQNEGLMRMNPPQPMMMPYGHPQPMMGQQPGRNVPYPTMLYPSQFGGPVLFLFHIHCLISCC